MNEGIACFQDNELVCGVLDKNAFGASAFGLVHVCCINLTSIPFLMFEFAVCL